MDAETEPNAMARLETELNRRRSPGERTHGEDPDWAKVNVSTGKFLFGVLLGLPMVAITFNQINYSRSVNTRAEKLEKIVGTWEAQGIGPSPARKITFTKGGSLIDPTGKDKEAVQFNIKSPNILELNNTTLNQSVSFQYEITNDGLLIFKRPKGNAVFRRVTL